MGFRCRWNTCYAGWRGLIIEFVLLCFGNEGIRGFSFMVWAGKEVYLCLVLMVCIIWHKVSGVWGFC